MTHPITPPSELVQQWMDDLYHEPGQFVSSDDKALATRAAQWGADQELLACGNYLKQCAAWEEEDVTEFYNYRRPKPPSLKEQALDAHNRMMAGTETQDDWTIVRLALEALPDE
jgi:hypothetical protein